ncbi:SPFH domain-containing protein [Frankia sp. EI5c]|uniref:SPFH domain-containing protein n=1 Tax=Frankia sp. EI5c TaxID=683316 RepID=UPI0007C35DCB|nr:SPFH domain-containing protein [Frankia sp. EI5c]OAA18111.1 SPFH domain-containing protein [Frankia sp. EI5c]
MADISRAPFLRHLRGTPTAYVRHLSGGKTRHEGVGLSFWYRPRTAVISEIPVEDRELPLLFHARTSDFQDVAVQATVTYRVAAPALAASRLDFGIDPETGAWRSSPLEQLGGLIVETAQQHAFDLLAHTTLTGALVDGVPAIRQRIAAGLMADERLSATGVAVVGVRVVAIRPEPELEKALRTPTREQVQAEADRATYGRRALAVEQERRIAENEMQNQIELARREEELVTRRGANERRAATEKAAAGRIAVEAQAEHAQLTAAGAAAATRLAAAARAEEIERIGSAEASAERARVEALHGLDNRAAMTLAVRDLAGRLPDIQALTITPDVLSDLLSRLAGAARTGDA